MGKRPNNDGALFFSESEQTWIAEVVLPDGKKRRKRNKKQSIVRAWLHEQREAIRTNTITDPTKYTVKTYCEAYIATATGKLKPRTIESYNWIIDKHIIPAVGHLKLTSVTGIEIERLFAEKRAEGLSERTVEYIHDMLRAIFNDAVKKNLLVRNPVNTVESPKPPKHYVEPLSVAQVQTFMEVVATHRLRALWLLALGTGLRIGELLALTHDCINWDTKTLTVKRTVAELRGTGIIFGTPKSEASRRVVGIPEFALEALKAHKGGTELVFATGNDTPFSHRNVLRYFKGILEKAGLPQSTRIHDLRHTYISHLLASGTPVKDVQMIAGHSQFDTTMDLYAHMLPGAQQKAAERIDALFGKKP